MGMGVRRFERFRASSNRVPIQASAIQQDNGRARQQQQQPDYDPAANILRNVAMYRCIIFCILVYEWNHYLPEVENSFLASLTDSWCTYDQFQQLFTKWTPTDMMKNKVVTVLGTAAGLVAAAGGIPWLVPFEVAGAISVGLYLCRFLTFAHMFTNHNYLFALLGILTSFSGGGSFWKLAGESKETKEREIQRCEWIALTIRMQYAVVYFFASLWKFHPDWLQGHIVKGIMMSFEDQHVNRGVPWHSLYESFPDIFVYVAAGGLILDTGMFLALTFRRPSKETSRMFTVMSALFHCSVCFTMSQRIGYSFPATCLAGSILCQPIGSEMVPSKKDEDVLVEVNHVDTNLISWIKRYVTGKGARATHGQRMFTLLWLFFQLAIPFRMPIISKGTFPYTAKGYRFSWTMMLHGRSTLIQHTGSAFAIDGSATEKMIALELLYLMPECGGTPVQRKNYMSDSANPMQDPRNLPLSHMLGYRHFAFISVFPRYIARVAGGMSELMYKLFPDGCQGRRVSVYGAHFAQLNGHGPYHRTFDPTVDLAASDALRYNRSWFQLWKDVLLDRAPRGRNEYLLSAGIGGSMAKVDNFRLEIQKKMPHIKRVEFIADRAECLAARPLALWPDGFPLGILPLEVPKHSSIYVDGRQKSGPFNPDDQWDGLSEPERVQVQFGMPQPVIATSVEIGITLDSTTKSNKTCAETDTEDVIIALLFMA